MGVGGKQLKNIDLSSLDNWFTEELDYSIYAHQSPIQPIGIDTQDYLKTLI